ncbi:MAG: DUF362 domain-containing protein [Sphaerochaetaceae bacterium]|nr:DUF362 domain-containing protein [Sphaerochaetaceae bacterium]
MNKNEIIVTYGNQIKEMTLKLLEASKIESLIPSKKSRIGLKPNLVVARTPEGGATTHPQIVTTIIEYLQERGYSNIKIIESAWVGDSTKRGFKVNGYYEISEKYNVPLFDVKDDKYIKKTSHGITMELSKEILDLDFLISIPVLKGHCQTLMTCALKNMKGCLSDSSKRLFHSLGLSKPIATLNAIRVADLVIVDSINGDLDFEEGGTPVKTNRMFIARDSVLCDTFAASLLGFKSSDIEYIEIAEKLGVGSTNLNQAKISYVNKPEVDNISKPTGIVNVLSENVLPIKACSACYGNLIHALKRLDEENMLHLSQRICIGQGYKEIKDKSQLGVGVCTRNLGKSLKGCPSSASEMVDFIKNNLI